MWLSRYQDIAVKPSCIVFSGCYTVIKTLLFHIQLGLTLGPLLPRLRLRLRAIRLPLLESAKISWIHTVDNLTMTFCHCEVYGLAEREREI